MLEISGKTNLLEQKSYKYSLQDVAEPNLHRDIYSYGTAPKVAFNHRRVPMNMPEEIWITDTSLRDGQQSVEPYTVDQIVNIYKLLHQVLPQGVTPFHIESPACFSFLSSLLHFLPQTFYIYKDVFSFLF